MSFHQAVADMRQYVRRTYGAGTQLLGPPIPMQGSVWNVWIQLPGGSKRNIRVRHEDVRRLTSNDPSRRRKAKRKTRTRRVRDPMSGIGKTGDAATWKKRKAARQWGVFVDGSPNGWYGDKGQALDAARELRASEAWRQPPLKIDVRSKSVRTLRLGYLYKRKRHGRQKESKYGHTKYLHGDRYRYAKTQGYRYPGMPRSRKALAKRKYRKNRT